MNPRDVAGRPQGGLKTRIEIAVRAAAKATTTGEREPGAVAPRDGRVISVIAFETRDGLITRIHAMANPHKIAYVASLLEGK